MTTKTKKCETMNYKTKEIETALLKKGFKVDRKRHHKYYTFSPHGEKSKIITFTSHGNVEYGGKLLSKMRRQLFLRLRSI